ncbi:MAG: NAD-dependent epimerase/dehydratase family protein [Thermoanaerobaculia bacterium]
MPQKPLVALTGGTGFVGSHVADALLAAGYRVRALVRRPEDPGWLKGLDVEISKGDIRERACLDALVPGAAAVVHVAGKTSAKSEADYMAANAAGTANVVTATKRRAGEAHFIFLSSLAAAGPSRNGNPVKVTAPARPVSSYGRSKLAGEEEVRRVSGIPYTILRSSAVYGPRETAIRDLFVAASKGIVPVLAGGTPRIQLVYALDVAAAVIGALRRGGRGETFFVAHPEVLTYESIARTLATLPERKPFLLPVPAALIRLAGVVVGAVTSFSNGPPVFNAEKAGEMLEPAWICDVSEAQVALGQPFTTDFATGARKTWEWYLEKRWIRSDNIAARKRN